MDSLDSKYILSSNSISSIQQCAGKAAVRKPRITGAQWVYMRWQSTNYTTDGLVVVTQMDDDNWEEDLLDKLEQTMKSMGMPMNREQLRPFIRMIKEQLDNSGIDLEKIAGMPNLNLDLDSLFKSLSSGESIEDLLKNLGVAVQVDMAPVDLDPSALETNDEETISLPSDDVYLDGWNMAVTLDFTLKGDIPSEQLEIELIKQGSQMEILRSTQPKPIALVDLPHPCDDVVNWTLNNGILDITLKLTPQGKALESENDDLPSNEGVNIDVGDTNGDNDDDEDDGGIPIF